ncbi:short-chain dehydrogenase [Agarivorans sp. Toyoura001]|uniref:SDR family oxidoreductase n=1 Tax=Agarivorans sp. Toyoura001 TaxID=2283141 RepID=UPI0010EEB00A|nr:SDR family oxidoreductase [Agarivorans sp. Toyoura001]GDY27748.1 short-chain dehydrogenase [Agarivorans sp. Toyoura001]
MSKVALVTGSSRGIGAATACLLAEQGYSVCINYKKNQAAASEVVERIQSTGGTAIAIRADISDEHQVEQLFNHIDQQLGPINALVNNAAMLFPQMRLEAMNAQRINQLFSVNVTSAFMCCKYAIKRMGTSHGGSGGSIVNVSSAAARVGSPFEYIDYAASKGAIDTLTKGLSLELAEQAIRVNGVRPGFIHTEMHADGGEPNRIERLRSAIPLQRGGEPEEIAEAIAWLISDKASYVTGSILDVTGGR